MKKSPVSLLLLLALGGCNTTTNSSPGGLQPVDHGIPTLQAGVYEPENVSVKPIPTRQRRPAYPFELRRAGIAGEGVISFIVRFDGSVTDVAIVRASDVRFGSSAAECVSEWQFRPALVNGKPVDCRMMVPILFRLN